MVRRVELTHVDAAGAARMVDVSGKDATVRTAVATGTLRTHPITVGRCAGQRPRTVSEESSSPVAFATASTARSNASALCAAGARNPEIFRTYCSAAARTSSSVTCSVNGGRRVLMLLHMPPFNPPPPTTRQAAPARDRLLGSSAP